MRTYTRADLDASREAWADYGPEWARFRTLASDRGMLFPPAGSRFDSWEDAEPSQRAIVYRALEDTPRILEQIIRVSRSWSEVVRKLMADLDRRRDDADFAERDVEWERQYDLDPQQATSLLGAILGRIRESLP